MDFNFSCLFFADSGIQSVGDSIRGSSDSMSNGGPSHSHESSTNASSASTTMASSSKNSKTKQENHAKTTPEQHFESLVQKVFGGKMQTTYECSNCKSVSLHKECFTDLHLAFPEKTKNDLTMQVKVFLMHVHMHVHISKLTFFALWFFAL